MNVNVSLNLSITSADQLDAILNTLEQRGLLASSPVTGKPITPASGGITLLKKSPVELEYNKTHGTFRLTKQEADILASGACTRDDLIRARLDMSASAPNHNSGNELPAPPSIITLGDMDIPTVSNDVF